MKTKTKKELESEVARCEEKVNRVQSNVAWTGFNGWKGEAK